MIKFKCDFCDQRLGVPDNFVGKRVRCTKCRAVNTVASPEEQAKKDQARAQAELPVAMKATLPSAPAPSAKQKMPLHSSLLDLSSNSGSFAGELPQDPKDVVADSVIFKSTEPLPAFTSSEDELSFDDPSDGLDDSVVGLADTGRSMTPPRFDEDDAEQEELSFDPEPSDARSKPSPRKPSPPKSSPPKPKKPEVEDLDMPLPTQEDLTDSSGGNVDLDGLGF